MKKEYKTKRLLMKILDENHGEKVLEYFYTNKEFLREWETVRDEKFYTLSFQKQLLKDDYKKFLDGGRIRFWLFLKDDPDKVIGTISLDNIIRGPFLSCFMGYRLHKDYLNKGYMTEAVKMMVKIAFNEYSLHRIEANIMPRNLPSIKVVEKVGFINEGLSRKYLKINGVWEDHIHMVILNEEEVD